MRRPSYKLSEIATLIGGELNGDGNTVIQGVGGIKDAGPGQITFLSNPVYARFLAGTRASAAIIAPDVECPVPSVCVKNPYLGFLKVLETFAGAFQLAFPPGIHPSAVVDSTADIGDNASIGPCCGVGERTRIGARSVLMHGTWASDDVEIGSDCLVYPNVVIRERTCIGDRAIIHPGAVIGADGFGFAQEGKRHRKIPQIGRVVIGDDVEVGANSTIDRAAFGETRIGNGVKIDNLVQVAHNVVIGDNTVIAALAGLSGSLTVGENVMMGGQAGLAGHIEIGDRAVVAAQSGVAKSIPPDTVVSGYPASEHGLQKRIWAYTARLPEIYRRIKALEKRIGELESEEK